MSYLSSEWNNSFITNHQEMVLDCADFPLQEKTEENVMVNISQAWYTSS